MPEGSYGQQLLKQPDPRFHRCYSSKDLQLHLLRKEQPRQFGKYHGTDKSTQDAKEDNGKDTRLKNLVRSVIFKELMPIPATSIGRRAFKAKFME